MTDEPAIAPADEPASAPAPMNTHGLAPPDKAADLHPRRKLAVGALMMGMLLGALDNTIVVTVLPNIVTDLGQVDGLPFVVSAYLIAQTIAMPIFGKLSDHYGRRLFFVMGLVIFMAGSILSGLAQNLNQLIVFRAVQGVGSGAFFPVANAIIGVMFGPRERAKLSGAFAATFGIASVLGPLAGSSIVGITTWRWIFYINLPVGVLSLVLVMMAMGPLRGEGKAKFDWAGAALLGGWVAAFMLALEETGNTNGWKWTDPITLAVLGVGAALFAAFLWRESKAEDPVLPLRFFKIRVVAATSAVSFLRGFMMITTLTYASVFVAFALREGADNVRNMLYGMLVPMVVGASIGGVLLPRTGFRPMMTIGMILMTLGGFLMTLVTASTPSLFGIVNGVPAGMFLYLMPLGFGIGMTFAPAVLVVQYALPRKDIGVGTSMVQFLMNVGGAFGVSILGSYQASRFAALAAGHAPPAGPADFLALQSAAVTSIHEVFLIAAIVGAFAVIPALLVKGHLPKEPTPGDAVAAVT